MAVNKYRVTSVKGLRVRPEPNITAKSVFTLPFNALVDIVDIVRGEDVEGDNRWAKITREVEFGNVVVETKYYFVSMKYLVDSSVTQPPPPPPNGSSNLNIIGIHPALPLLKGTKRLGMHVFNRVDVAKNFWIPRGCDLFTVMDNVEGARELRNMGKAVAYRRYHKGVIEPWLHLQQMGLGKEDKLITLGRNEQDMDEHFDNSLSGIKARISWQANWDFQFAQAVWDNHPQCIPCVPNNAMGNPPRLELREVAEHFAKEYRWLWDNKHRCLLGYHMYDKRWSPEAPPREEAVETSEWYSRRWFTWLVDQGLVPDDVIHFGDECFIDFGGKGGSDTMKYGNYPGMTKKWYTQASPFNRKALYGATIFQGLDGPERTEWWGYTVKPIAGELQEIWQGNL